MTPYYQDDLVTLYHGDCREVLAGMGDRSVDLVLTDPPYDDRTHKGAKTNKGKGHGVKAIHFDSFTHERQVDTFATLGRITRRWVVATLATSTRSGCSCTAIRPESLLRPSIRSPDLSFDAKIYQ